MDIIVENLSKSFGEQQVIKELSFTLKQGSCTCLMGPSGVGKTTLLNLLMGFFSPDSGSISGLSGRKIAAVFQEDRLIEGSDAFSNLQAVMKRKLSKAELEEHFAAIGLTEYAGKPVSALSGGMKRRVAILRALLSDHDFLILDEPFKGLNEELKEKVISYVKAKTAGDTVLMVTHDPAEAKAMGAEIITLE